MAFTCGSDRARSRGRSLPPLICFIPDLQTYSVPLFLSRQCDRTPGSACTADGRVYQPKTAGSFWPRAAGPFARSQPCTISIEIFVSKSTGSCASERTARPPCRFFGCPFRLGGRGITRRADGAYVQTLITYRPAPPGAFKRGPFSVSHSKSGLLEWRVCMGVQGA